MKVREQVRCTDFPCTDVRHECYVMPSIELDPQAVSIVLISEAAPPDPADSYYAPGESLFQRTTIQAFQDAGAAVSSLQAGPSFFIEKSKRQMVAQDIAAALALVQNAGVA